MNLTSLARGARACAQWRLWTAALSLILGVVATACGSSAGGTGFGDSGSGSSTTGSGSGGGWGGSGTAGTGTGSGAGSGDPQSWQKTTDDLRFPSVSLGGGKRLELQKMRVTVRSEGLRTRTLVDHIFYNPFGQAIEGTFRYPLPSEATVSYFAMFPGTAAADPAFFGPADPLLALSPAELAKSEPDAVVMGADPSLWASGKVAKVVRAVDATRAYEHEASKKVDPALVEPVAPNSFRARVYPIPANGYMRILVAYEQTLPRIGDKLDYTFPLAKDSIGSLDFLLTAPSSAVSAVSSVGNVEEVMESPDPQGFTFSKSLTGESPGGTLEFLLTPLGGSPEAEVLSGSDPAVQQDFFVARVHPAFADLPAVEGSSKQAVFLIDTSLSEQPDQFNVNRQLLQGILEGSPDLLRFNVLTFDASARWLAPTWVNNDAAGRAQVLASLDALLLEGATDFGAALRALASPGFSPGPDPRLDAFVLSDGVLNWGDTSVETLVQRYEQSSVFQTRFFAYRTGLAGENLDLYRALTRRGGIFNCFGPASLPACSKAHQATGVILSSVTVEGVGPGGATVTNTLVAGRQATLFPGAELTVAGRLLSPGPAVVHLVGKTRTSDVDVSVPVTLTPSGTLAPRAWGELAVSQLLSTHDAALDGIAMAISQRYRIGSRLGSFLILDNPADYTAYDLEDESAKFSGQTISGLVDASLFSLGGSWTSWDRLRTTLVDYDDVNHLSKVDGGKLLSTLEGLVAPAALELPSSSLAIPAVLASTVPQAYLDGISHEPDAIQPFITEAERRRKAGDVGGAVRALSTLTENDPSNAEVERLIGYRVSSWDQVPEASSLFLHVLERRPFEPPSYRDLANALGTARPALSAMLFESVLAGSYDAKYGRFKTISEEEYALFMDQLAQESPGHPLNPYLAKRKSALGLVTPQGRSPGDDDLEHRQRGHRSLGHRPPRREVLLREPADRERRRAARRRDAGLRAGALPGGEGPERRLPRAGELLR